MPIDNDPHDCLHNCPHDAPHKHLHPIPENDDLPVGRLLSRREVLALLGAGTTVLVAGAKTVLAQTNQSLFLPLIRGEGDTSAGATPVPTSQPTAIPTAVPACVARPEVTEGPYFVDERLNRADIRSDPTTGVIKEGTLLTLTFNVSQVSTNSCTLFAGAIVDIWHCDAAGVYSDTSDPGFNTVGQKFLRGYQVTDANGQATFTTIYPGWYAGRTVHIHFKIRISFDAGAYDFTSQLFFDDTFTDQVFTQQPYASKGQRNTRNSNDNIYDAQLLLVVSENAQGYRASFDVGLEMN